MCMSGRSDWMVINGPLLWSMVTVSESLLFSQALVRS